MPPAGFEPTISAGERPLGPAARMFRLIKYLDETTGNRTREIQACGTVPQPYHHVSQIYKLHVRVILPQTVTNGHYFVFWTVHFHN